MVDDPGGEPHRRIRQRVERLWPAGHFLRVAQSIRIEIDELVPGMLFLGIQTRGFGAAGDLRGNL